MVSTDELQKVYKILSEHEKRLKELESIIDQLRKRIEEVNKVKEVPGFQKLSKRTGIHESILKKLFDVEDESITLLDIIGESYKQKIQNATLVILLAYKYILGIEEVLAQEIRRNIAELGIPLNNFANYLKEIIPTLIRRKGRPRSPKTIYKLTVQGEVRAKEILKTLGGTHEQTSA